MGRGPARFAGRASEEETVQVDHGRAISVVLGALAAVLALTGAAGCGAGSAQTEAGQPPATGQGPTIPPDIPSTDGRLVEPATFAMAITKPDRITINVHVPYEGDLPGTDMSIPFDRLGTEAARLPAARGTPLAIYCKSGRMSATAAAELDRLGYDDVVELSGGMEAWVRERLPLEPSGVVRPSR